MTITASDEVYRRLEEVKEWLESRLEREATLGSGERLTRGATWAQRSHFCSPTARGEPR